jgi:hypothetical protein
VSATLDVTRPEPGPSRDNGPPPMRASRSGIGRLAVGGLVLCLVLSVSIVFLVMTPNSLSESNREGPILVVGDSLVAQATNALQSWNLPSVPIIAEGGVGSAPCDWAHGYSDPLTGHHVKFSDLVNRIQPVAVVFAFTGNPGLDSRSNGCVNSSLRYALPSLLSSYERALTEMARYASYHDARVYIAASPPRNPSTPAGSYTGSGGNQEYGFNGVPALNRLFESISRSSLGRELHWSYDRLPAQFVSTSDLNWRRSERCLPWDAGTCTNGTVQVRAGGFDSIHLV